MNLLKLFVLKTSKFNICFSSQQPNRKQTVTFKIKFLCVSICDNLIILKVVQSTSYYQEQDVLSPLGVIRAHYNILIVLSFENTII